MRGKQSMWGRGKGSKRKWKVTIALLSALIVHSYMPAKQASADSVVYLSDAYWSAASIGWGNIHLNRSVTNGPLYLSGQKYLKGLGTHANSSITYELGGEASRFQSVVGLDDGNPGSIVFQVFADNVKKFDSGTMTAGSPKQTVDVSIAGVKQLRLVVTDAGNGISDDHANWADAKVTVAGGAGIPALAPPSGNIGNPDSPKGDYYDYTINSYPERPYIRDYSQIPFTKIYLASKDPSNPSGATVVKKTFEQALESIKQMDNLMLGATKIVYLVGWQYEGHDSKYPSWDVVNPELKRPEDATALDSLKWLMSEAYKYHTIVSLHINMADAYQDSPLWKVYNTNDIVAKDTNGNLIPGVVWSGQTSYQIDYKQEWQTGFAKQRIDRLLSMLPIQAAGTIHIDAFNSKAESHPDIAISPYLGNTLSDEQSAQRTILRYWRQKGVDVTTEFPSGNLKPDAFTGLEASSWHSGSLDLPSYLRSDTPLEDMEDQLLHNDWDGVRTTALTHFIPWYYKNNISAEIGTELHDDGEGNIFYPALWLNRTVAAYSSAGYSSKTWTLQPGWGGVTRATLYTITATGPRFLADIPVMNNQITFGMTAGQALKIVPLDGQVTFKLSTGFGSAQGLNGWSYQEWNGSSYANMNWVSSTGKWKGSGTYNLIWSPSQIHPDGNDSVITWTAPQAGSVTISGNPRKQSSGGDGVNVKIMKNGSQIWPATGWAFISGSNTGGLTHNLTISVSQGDQLHFVVNNAGTNVSDETNWNPVITYGGAPIGQTIWLRSNSNGKNTVAWANQPDAPLKSNSTVLGDWEKFLVVDAGEGYVALKALSNNKYVVAWADRLDNPLLANSSVVGGWERLQWVDAGAGNIYLKAFSNGNYVLARSDDTDSPLRANSSNQGDWEKFSWGIYP